MVIIKSFAVSILTIIIGPWLGFALCLLAGYIYDIEPILGKKLPELSMKRFRHFWQFGWRGFTVGTLNALSIRFFDLNWIIFLVLFVVYLLFFMKHKTEYVLNNLSNGDSNQFRRTVRKTATITFFTYLLGLIAFSPI